MANYTIDANMVSYWYMEQATAANAPDGKSANELTKMSDAGGPAQSADHKQGSYSADLTSSAYEYYERLDADLSAGFPGKDSGGGTGSFSIGAWIKPDLNQAHGIISKMSNGEEMSYCLYSNGTNIVFKVTGKGWDWDATITGSTEITDDGTTWYHCVGVFDTDTNYIYLYVNGASDATAVSYTGSIYLGASPFHIGRGNGFLDGHIDEAFIMSRALSASEVDEIYTYGLEGGSSGRTTKNTRAFPHGIFRGIRRMMGG